MHEEKVSEGGGHFGRKEESLQLLFSHFFFHSPGILSIQHYVGGFSVFYEKGRVGFRGATPSLNPATLLDWESKVKLFADNYFWFGLGS